MKRRCVIALGCAPALFLLAAPAMGQQYSPGYEWNRHDGWLPGAIPGSSIGNPQPDGEGRAAWQYEHVQGGPIGSANQWFAQPSNLMVWDDNWWDIAAGGAWVKDDNVNPPIFNNRMTHNIHDTQFQDIPMIRWINPVGDGTLVDIAGNLGLTWSGHDFIGVPMGVEVVIALNDFSAGTTSLLLEDSLTKPTPFPSVGDSVGVPVTINEVTLDEGDSILISLRADDAVAGDGRWIVLEDNVSITLIPAPGAAGLLGMAGLMMLRRRRR